MHELALARDICDAAARHVPAGNRLRRVVVEMGPLSGVVPDALEFGFGIASREAGLGDVALEVCKLSAAGRCPACHAPVEVTEMWMACPGCGHQPVTAQGGGELRLREIEVEDV